MEDVHKPSQRVWIDDNIINVRKFLEEFSEELSSEALHSRLEDIISPAELHDIEEKCGPHATRCDYQEKVEIDKQLNIPDGVHLKTLWSQKNELERRKEDKKYFRSHYVAMKYTNYPSHKILKVDLQKFPPMPVNMPEVVLSVQIYYPERRIDSKVVNYAKMPAFHEDQEFLVLGCQYLTELREVIDCVSDKAIPGDFSDCPNALPTVTCKDIFKSGFFYINGVFYNDMRYMDCKDYSETIIKWSKDRGIGPFKKAVMEETRFIDLTLHLGYPYVYIHQGHCEHIVVFTDLRLFSKHDVNNKNAYPLCTKVKPLKRILCMICRIYIATWVVYDNKRLPENPFFFCKTCFQKFNYVDGKKIGEFRAYYFPDRTKLL